MWQYYGIRMKVVEVAIFMGGISIIVSIMRDRVSHT